MNKMKERKKIPKHLRRWLGEEMDIKIEVIGKRESENENRRDNQTGSF